MDATTIGFLLGKMKGMSSDGAAEKLENMTVSAAAVTGEPTAAVSTVDGHYHVAFGLVKGDTGEAGLGAQEATRALPVNTVTANEAVFSDAAEGIAVDSLVVHVQPWQEGEGAPSPENVRPIHGWESVTVHAPTRMQITEEWQKLKVYGQTRYPVGTEIVIGRYINNDLVWQVADYGTRIDPATGKARSCVTLITKEVVQSLYYKQKEAMYYVDEAVFPDGMPAGTYYFTCMDRADYADDNGKTFQFTLAGALPVGAQIEVDATAARTIAGKNVICRRSTTDTTEIVRAALSEGSEGTYLGATDGGTPNMNYGSRIFNGGNNYAVSDPRKWMNDKIDEQFKWWTPTGRFDKRPVHANQYNSFLSAFSSDFVAALATTGVSYRTNSVYEDGYDLDTEYSAQDKFFLPSLEEVGLGETQDQTWALFAGTDGATMRCKRDYANQAQFWWLRSCVADSASQQTIVDSAGKARIYNCNQSAQVAPACVLWTDDEETITYDLSEAAGTVYGGTLDVTRGLLTVTKGYIDSYKYLTIPQGWISSHDVNDPYHQLPSYGAQVVYNLYKPVTYTLTPHEVKCLLANNRIWSEAGDVTVKYRMTVEAYVEKRLAEWQQAMEAAAAAQDGGE